MLAESRYEALSLEQAAAASGYTADHLSRLVKDGQIPNAGRKHPPRILRNDLPRKPGSGRAQAPRSDPGAVGATLADLSRDIFGRTSARRDV